jgi:protein SCO1/2
VTDTDVFTKPTIVYFGYTFCPDVCPLDNARNAEVEYLLEQQGKDIQTVFISIDPQRDTPEIIAAFTDFFHSEMLGLTGTQDQVDALAASYGAFYEIRDPEDEFYLVDHSTFSYFVLPNLGFVDLIGRGEYADEIAERLNCIMDEVAA